MTLQNFYFFIHLWF